MFNFNITQTPWFTLLTQQERERLLGTSAQLDYAKDETIVKQGYVASHVLYLESGIVKLNVENSGKKTTFKIMKGGNFIGLMCTFVNKILDFSAVAATPSRVHMLNRDLFESLIRENGEFALYTVNMMSELTNSVVHNLINLSHKNVNGSVATLLVDLCEIYESNSFDLPFGRGEMADTLGYSKESIVNTLGELQKDGVIRLSGRKVKIDNLNILSNIAKNG